MAHLPRRRSIRMPAPPSDTPPPDSPLATLPSTDDAHVINRVFLEAGGIGALVARDAPMQRLLSDAEREQSLLATLALRPPGDAWLFGYGSLIWNPTVHSVERRVAHVTGWHRAFCLSVQAGRGSIERPGLVLGLDAGGDCTGVAYRIEESLLRSELELLWRREMVSGSYIPRWLDIHDAQGRRFGSAIAFTMDSACAQYAGHLCEDDVVQRLATAQGALGSAADYLFRTCESLRGCGIEDAHMEELARSVLARQQQI
jgi:cation transport protein ChaC